MNRRVLFLYTFFLFACVGKLYAQGDSEYINFQRGFPRAADALLRREDTLRAAFEKGGLTWPAKYLYIRSFKYDGQLEVWVKNERKDSFKLFHTYRVCALAGSLGPKRMEGDYQVPEGFYYINELNPRSNYHLSLGLNYPNASDRVLSDSLHPGGDIYIHGSCVTVGCIPIKDEQIEDLYILATHARNSGQDFIPVHIFPIRYDVKRSVDYLAGLTKTDTALRGFAAKLEKAFDHFEATRSLPIVATNDKGEYVYYGLAKKKAPLTKPQRVRVPVVHRIRAINDVAEVVHEWPVFPGGGQKFLDFLSKTGAALKADLPSGIKKAYVQVEFIVDRDGVPVNFKVSKGVNKDLDDDLITALEKMPNWKPAILKDKPVAKRMKQSFVIE